MHHMSGYSVPMNHVAGADVWKGQWVVVVLEDGRFRSAFVRPTASDALEVDPLAATAAWSAWRVHRGEAGALPPLEKEAHEARHSRIWY